jgi:hypothetical protein
MAFDLDGCSQGDVMIGFSTRWCDPMLITAVTVTAVAIVVADPAPRSVVATMNTGKCQRYSEYEMSPM